MVEPKPLASLSSSLLARKGDARPAIRRAYVPIIRLPHSEAQDDLGWNDIGTDALSPARKQQERITQIYSTAAPPAPRKEKVAFTLRLDSDRHLRLRLASAVGNRSAQQIVTEALDVFLNQRHDLDALVDKARRSGF